LILIAAALIVREAVDKMINGVHLEVVEVGIGVMAVAIVVNSIVSRYLYKVSRSTDSLALEADAAHLSTDVLTMAGVFIGLILVRVTGWQMLDPIVATVVALLIVKAAVDIIRKSFGGLMDVSLPDAEQKAIEKLLLEHRDHIVEFHRLRTRKVGSQRQIDLHLVIPKVIHVEDAHALCDHLETDIEHLLKNAEVNIHVEPCASTCSECRVICELKQEP
jgi:cation diffusion facilitator family transporter